jgi:enoyl-CoA hydratase/carnithine racemase
MEKQPADYQDISFELNADVARITLNRPSSLNAIAPRMLEELTDAFWRISDNDTVVAVVLTGAGNTFSAGVDLKWLHGQKVTNGNIGELLDKPARSLIVQIESMPQAVIAQVNGHCYTGALEIVLACDIVVAAEDARFGDTHAKWGLRPSWGMSQRLPRLVGMLKAKELAFTAVPIKGVEAERIGLINRAVPRDELDDVVNELVELIKPQSRAAIAAYKDLFLESQFSHLQTGLSYEANSDYQIPDTGSRLAEFVQKSKRG